VTTQAIPTHGSWLDGHDVRGPARSEVHDKFDGTVLAYVYEADAQITRRAVDIARKAADGANWPVRERAAVLERTAQEVERNVDSLAEDIARETGFTVADCAGDIRRAVETLRLSGQEATRLTGEVVPVGSAAGFEDRLAFTMRVPVGVVCAITPFNSPLNTVAHKIAPALAAGNTVVLSPSTHTPLAALWLTHALERNGLPPGRLNVVLGGADPVGSTLLDDDRLDFFTFTGSTTVGRTIARHLGLRRANLELGNVSATIVCADAHLEHAVASIARAGFRKAGQVCTSVQRLYVERGVVDAVARRLADIADGMRVGDPRAADTEVGPMISEASAVRADGWVESAVAEGAQRMTTRGRDGALFPPTVLTNVSPTAQVVCEEIFAPVISIIPFDTFDEAIDAVNASPYGLQAGIFTQDIDRALSAAKRLRVGGVVINETSSTRADLMPYGGVKSSGYGKEGPRYAIREMTDERLVLIDHRPGDV